MAHRLAPLLLTGGPAVGKTVTATSLAAAIPRTAYVDVDDIRQLVKNGGAAPWEGAEGRAQQLLGVRNAAALTGNFASAGFNVTLTDVVTAVTLAEYRRLVPGVFVVRLSVSLEEAWRRARTRKVYLTDEEFESLHHGQSAPLPVDHQLDVTDLDRAGQSQRVRQLWFGHRG
ncbi:hypothetical protein [Humibacillus xanthopallidus]|uniref:Shikimate kinase n=1 Tax=Humibacillus xanthopallidus TaxID=412689 RepID=A0A543I231_9MICO|nr:hypothetical protein [Humibacillus xanthopallidus]TQM64636.1 hypothetical protein FBY41_1010 [Humibacillus xanthopallidus]